MVYRGCEITDDHKRALVLVRVVVYATDTLPSSGKVRKLKVSGMVWKGQPKRVPAPYAKIFSPYICFTRVGRDT